jgi:hypothetical protein
MSTKNYGPGTSGFLDPEGRNWETTVFQASKPILDKELNLSQDAEQHALRTLVRRSYPSGWISDNFLNSSVSNLADTSSPVANVLKTPLLWASVNGWLLQISNTNDNTGLNNISLGAGPAGVGAKRTDFVILEVWRRLLPAAPTTTGKSPTGLIWRDGNVKIASADDLTLNYADDIKDGAVGAETTKRVQIQYRLRVINGVDLFTYTFGLDDPSLVAHSVPTNAATPDGSATVYTYTNQSANGDAGLWKAGNGDPANTLGTVDGYMYAIPLCAVFRRNTSAFSRTTNQNGGVASPGSSDRPDGLFHNIIAATDVYDMRRGTSPTGWDLTEVVQKNMNFLFDNVIQTEIGSTLSGGGTNGHTVMWADEIGISNANGGDGTITGDTPGADFIGEFDAVRRTFSDKVIYETLVLRYTPAMGSGGGPTWTNTDVISITPSALPIWPYSSFNWAASAPSGVSIVAIRKVVQIGESTGQKSADLTNAGVWSASGLGGVPQGTVSFNVGNVNPSAPLFITIVVAYPPGVGLSKTPTNTYSDNGTVPSVQGVYINNPGQLPSSAPVYYSALSTPTFKKAQREVTLTYRTVSHTLNYWTTTASPSPTSTIYLPERAISGTISMTISAVPYAGPITLASDGYSFDITPTVIGAGNPVVITYQSVRPLPKNGEQLTIYYETRVSQTIRSGVLGTSLQLTPRVAPNTLYVLTSGSGSDGEAYPFPTQYVQVGGVYPGSGGSFDGDHELNGELRVSTPSVFLDTGFMQLMSHLPVVPLPEALTFTRSSMNVDVEGRSFFPLISGGYKPFAVAEVLSDPKKHKNVLPLLCELTADGPVGQKGQLVLVVLSRWAVFDDSNSILFDPTAADNTTTASVYRLKGNLLSNRRS